MLSLCARSVHNMMSTFVRNARTLEKYKTSGVPDEAFQSGKYLLFVKNIDSVLVDSANGQLLWKSYSDLENDFKSAPKVILNIIGDEKETCLFAIDLMADGNGSPGVEEKYSCKVINARKALFTLSACDVTLLTQARGLINFLRSTNFCSTCGANLTTKFPNQKHCIPCNKAIYPNLSPVGITLIENRSHSSVLLVRQSRHPRGMYSCVAGFIEPGESLEDNVRREIAEEVGVTVGTIVYKSSQHWALPDSQLMLGCIATATSDDFSIDENEIENAKWIDSSDLKDAINRAKQMFLASDSSEQKLWVPPPSAVAHNLMELWLTEFHNYKPASSSHM